MKFFTPFLTVIAASSVLGLTIPTKREEVGIEDDYDYSYLGNNPIFPIKKECNDAIAKLKKENEECEAEVLSNDDLSSDNVDDYKKFCEAFNSEKCQKYYNIKYSEIPECKSSKQDVISMLEEFTKTNLSYNKVKCATDEKGNYCPLTQIEMVKRINKTMTEQEQEEIYDDILKDTCKSKKCADAYLTYFEDVEKYSKELFEKIPAIGGSNINLDSAAGIIQEVDPSAVNGNPVLNKTLTYLRSGNCTALAKTNSADAHSDAVTSMTYSSALFIALALLLFSLWIFKIELVYKLKIEIKKRVLKKIKIEEKKKKYIFFLIRNK